MATRLSGRTAAEPLATAKAAQAALSRRAQPERVPTLLRFFKTRPGEYGAGDQFRGLRVPAIREVVRQAGGLDLPELELLLASPWHEDRLAGLLIAVRQFARCRVSTKRRQLFRFYLRQARRGRINNWDLVDVSAEHVVGAWLRGRPEARATLVRLARSASLWERRIAVLAGFHGIRRHEFSDTLHLAAALRHDPHDLIHKAVGWMLREVGQRDRAALDGFLAEHAAHLPRTLLRYAIEKHAPAERRRWLDAGRRQPG